MQARAKGQYRNSIGEIIPGVTTALNELNKPALVPWANRMGLQGIDTRKYVDALADVGTLAHYFVMCRLEDEIPEVDEYSPEKVRAAEGCFKKYIEWERKNTVVPVFTEKPLISERYQYGGMVDLYAICNERLTLVDFKTNAKGIFPESTYQVAAYRQLLREHGYGVADVVILRLGRSAEEGAEEKILTSSELDNGFEIFIRCLDIYRLTRGGSFVCTGDITQSL